MVRSFGELAIWRICRAYLDTEAGISAVSSVYFATGGTTNCAQELQDTFPSVFREYNISAKIGYFIADNATSNDAALRLLSHHIDIKPARQRLRCGHVIDLVVKAILYGVDSECMLDAALSETDH